VAWQIPADDPALMAAEFGELAAQIGALVLLDARDPVASLHAVQAAYGIERFLLFDNAPDKASVAAFIPPAGRGQVFITSQNHMWPPGQALDVPVLDQEVAAEFLTKRTHDQNREAAFGLAGELGGVPLALEQATAHVQATGGTLTDYLASFRQRRAEMLLRSEPNGYGKTVATTWGLSFEHLQYTELSAIGLLRLLANCVPEAIPLRLLLQPCPGLENKLSSDIAPVLMPVLEDPPVAKDAIAVLRRHSLVTPLADGFVSVHRLVQAITVAQMPAELTKAWQRATGQLVCHGVQKIGAPKDTATWPMWQAMASHVMYVFEALRSSESGPADILMAAACAAGMAARNVAERGLYGTAEATHRGILTIQLHGLRADQPETLATWHEIARMRSEQGDRATADTDFREALAARMQVLGADLTATLITQEGIASVTAQQGDHTEAEAEYRQALAALERVLGADHTDTTNTRYQIARSWPPWTNTPKPKPNTGRR